MLLRPGLIMLVCLILPGCFAKGDPRQPIPSVLIPASSPATRLVVVLPGRADDVAALTRSGMPEAIQGAWPDADVLLAGVMLGYYLEGQAPQRLHRELIEPARKRGYREIWLAGASMGGMGVLLYERAFPNQVDGLILLAPYVGDRPILREIRQAGGIAAWDPGPVQAINADNWQHELWRHLQGWASDPAQAQRVWLAYGTRDRLRRAMPTLEALLEADQVLVRPGGHTWSVWSPATQAILERVDDQRLGACEEHRHRRKTIAGHP